MPQKVYFQKKGRLNLCAIHLQKNYEQKQMFSDVLQDNCVLKNFAIFTGKDLFKNHFFIKLQT